MDSRHKKIMFKAAIFIVSLSIAWWLVESGVLNNILDQILPIQFAAEILSGAFYTSFLTTPIAIAMFLSLAKDQNPIILSLLAGLGAASVDLLLVRFMRNNVNRDLGVLTRDLKLNLISKLLKVLKLDFIIPLLGALIIASPLPDELGLALLGASKLKAKQLFVLTYILNTAGILLIVTPINLLS